VRSTVRDGAAARVRRLRIVVLAAFALLAARAAHLTVADPTWIDELARHQMETRIVLPSARGLLVDRHERELAVTVLAPSVYVMPRELAQPEADIARLAEALGVPRRRLQQRLAGRDRFTYVARWIDRGRAERVEALGLAGVGVLREPSRAYPAGVLAAGAIGFANIDGVGVRGVEQQEDEWLRGEPQVVPVERDARGRLLAVDPALPAESRGGDVMLTLDTALQAEARASLQRSVEETGARAGIVVVLEPRSGELLAVAEAPGFDPNGFRTLDFRETRSRTFLDVFEPGSTLKTIVMAAALQTGTLHADDTIDTGEGHIQLPGKRIRDRRPFGVLTPADVLRVSSNVGITLIAQQLGAERHHRALEAFGFGARTPSGFPDEATGLLRPASSWRPVEQANIAFGQGIAVTAVQLAAAFGAIANDGEWRAPTLVRARRGPDGAWRDVPAPAARRVLSPEVARSMRGLLAAVVSPDGTGRRAGLADVEVAGKTGTAQKLDPETGTYSHDRFVSSFVGMAPAEEPRLVVVSVLDEPRGEANGGGDVAAPLFARVASAGLARAGIITEPQALPLPRRRPPAPPAVVATGPPPPADPPPAAAEPAPERSEARTPPSAPDTPPAPPPAATVVATRRPAAADVLSPAQRAALGSTTAPAGARIFVPDLRGRTLREVRRITAARGIRLDVLGSGQAVSQMPDPGSVIDPRRERVRVHFTETGHSHGPEGGT